MLPSMSRPANPYDNASCESFMETLKRQDVYANTYRKSASTRPVWHPLRRGHHAVFQASSACSSGVISQGSG